MHAQYELESSYIATVMGGMFATLPPALDIRLCFMTNGHLCMFHQALYPVEQMDWCVYALFINNEECTTNLAYSLYGISMGNKCIGY